MKDRSNKGSGLCGALSKALLHIPITIQQYCTLAMPGILPEGSVKQKTKMKTLGKKKKESQKNTNKKGAKFIMDPAKINGLDFAG